jgi:hypothetical protein
MKARQWPICHMCGLRCSPTGAWIDCVTPGADQEQVAVYYVNNLRGRIFDLPGHTLDLIVSQLPEHRRNYFERRALLDAEMAAFPTEPKPIIE